jgi:DNA-binding CsgD family transcriptional regulator
MAQLTDVARRIREAPWNPEDWPAAVYEMARISGFESGHLIGSDSAGKPTFSIDGGLPEGVFEAWMSVGGPEVVVNPRANAIFNTPDLHVIEDADFITEHERNKSPMYQDVYARFDVANCCITRVPISAGGIAIMTAMRPGRMGPPTASEKGAFAYLTSSLAEAVRLEANLEGQSANLALGAFDALRLATIVCDHQGRVTATSPSAEALLSDAQTLSVRNGRLFAGDAAEDRRLQRALREVLATDNEATPSYSSMVLRGPQGGGSIRVDVARLPRRVFGTVSAVILVHQNERWPSHGTLMGLELTHAEAEIALAMASGQSPREIAAIRRVSTETVRGQVKSVYAKLGVNRQAHLIAAMRLLA